MFKSWGPLSILITQKVQHSRTLASELRCQVRALALGLRGVLTPSQNHLDQQRALSEVPKRGWPRGGSRDRVTCAEASEDGGKSGKSVFAQRRSFLFCICCLSTNSKEPVYKTNSGLYSPLGSFLLPLRKALLLFPSVTPSSNCCCC